MAKVKNDYFKFIKQGDFEIDSIKKFANQQNVADFIVIGRLQKDEIIPWSKYQQYKKKYIYKPCN